MHQVHGGYTILARLKSHRADAASQLLAQMQRQPERLPFERCATVHFATGAVVPAETWGDDDLPPTLILATTFSGPTRAHVDELVRELGPGLRELFAHCECFPADATDRELAYFMKQRRKADTFYSGMHGLTRQDVLRQHELRGAIQELIDTHELPSDPQAARRAIQDHVAASPALAWAQESWAAPPGAWWAKYGRSFLAEVVAGTFVVALGLGSLALLCVDSAALGVAVATGWLAVVVLVMVMTGLVLGVRVAEDRQTHVATRPPDERVRAIAETQNKPVINEMTIAGPIKNGTTRPVFLRMLLWVIARVADGIPYLSPVGLHIPTVASARWIAMDRGKRLAFLSNFTNDAVPYVRDFIDIRDGAERINVAFGFGGGYPRTEWVFKRGALEDPNAFIHVVTATQRPTEFWFCPYVNLSIDNIVINRKIREGLFGPKSDDAARAWLRLL